ncbi:MAG: bifunctional nuclease family protein [Marinilabiliaceae bacterium]|jgi:bifunctional DNase/RNase|nr:bifunctional nuclease family protein [Marinilabiliaceae bacterium]
MKKIRLSVLGISYSQTQSGAYALVLAEEDGERRLPIIIGGFEAQAIVIKLENLNPPRPLTHDLFKSLSDLVDLELKEVFIHRLEEGVFYSQLICVRNGKSLLIDSRTSDAVALALRFECPIYITEEIMDKAGIVMEGTDYEEDLLGDAEAEQEDPGEKGSTFDKLPLKELKKQLDEAILKEDYERAAALRDELERRGDPS